MGCSASCASKVGAVNKNDPANIGDFTKREIEVIQRSWKRLSNDLPKRGVAVFTAIFKREPKVKQLFHVDHLEGDALLNNHVFKGHSSRFMQAVGAVVENIEQCDDAVGPLLQDLGARHTGFEGFDMKFYEVFEAALLEVWKQELGRYFNAEVEHVWKQLFKFIKASLMLGHALEEDKQKKSLAKAYKDTITYH